MEDDNQNKPPTEDDAVPFVPDRSTRLLQAVRRLRLAGVDPVAHLEIAADAEELFQQRGKARLRDLLAGPDTLHVLFAPSVLTALHLLRLASTSPGILEPDDKALRALADAVALRRVAGGRRGRPPKAANAKAAAELGAMVSAIVRAVRELAEQPESTDTILDRLRLAVPVLAAARGRRLERDIRALAVAVDDLDGKPSDAKRKRLVKTYLSTALGLQTRMDKGPSALLTKEMSNFLGKHRLNRTRTARSKRGGTERGPEGCPDPASPARRTAAGPRSARPRHSSADRPSPASPTRPRDGGANSKPEAPAPASSASGGSRSTTGMKPSLGSAATPRRPPPDRRTDADDET